ncbi:putative disease resistance protein RGA2 isoform X2 [Iris pallida]|uniref:Disease resistance protein RGA2 isoform X2 n=1 Tax=Iris pallida TaxID=29817 RepID=A0AAX6EY04_IRIPA|nr:putative disease resistance protein RGA2 isoform X2 [Iris pallida]
MAEAAITLKSVASAMFPIIVKLADGYLGGGVSADMMRDLKVITIPKIAVAIEAAETIPADLLRPWLMELKAAAYEAEDVLDEFEFRRIEDQVSPYLRLPHIADPLRKFRIKAKKFLGPVSLRTKLRSKLENLEKVAARVDEFIKLLIVHNDFKNTNPSMSSSCGMASLQSATMNQHVTASSVPGVVFGRDRERDNLINMLTSSYANELESSHCSWRVPVHAIYGIGGSGKTTLAQYIFNDPRIVNHFGDSRMWIHVSHRFDVLEITRKMIESATRGECPRIESLDTLQAKLKEIFSRSNNQMFLVLDDLWCDEPTDRVQLEKLLLPLREVGYKGSRVLLTTRTERVALLLGAKYIMPLKELEPEDCWSILKHYALGDARKATENAELAKVGEKIVEKLKNSPLAAKMVGIQLENKVHVGAWISVLNSDMLMNTRNVLLWSFKQLPPHLQRCFSFCSLYPKSMIFTHYATHYMSSRILVVFMCL